MFVPHTVQSTLVIFRNERIDKIEDVKEWDAAMLRASIERIALLSAGWIDVS